jgi:hypothetical protein
MKSISLIELNLHELSFQMVQRTETHHARMPGRGKGGGDDDEALRSYTRCLLEKSNTIGKI